MNMFYEVMIEAGIHSGKFSTHMNETDVHVKEKFKQNKKNPYRSCPQKLLRSRFPPLGQNWSALNALSVLLE